MATFVPPTSNSKNLVTTLAWCFIALSAFGTLMGLVQTFVLGAVLDDPKFNAVFSKANAQAGFPPYFQFITAHFRLFAAALLACSLVTLVSSIGLLKRLNWARLVFVVLLALGIVWNLASTVFQIAAFQQLPVPPDVARGMPDFKVFLVAAMLFGVAWAIGLSCLFGWLIKRLVAPDIVAEFRR